MGARPINWMPQSVGTVGKIKPFPMGQQIRNLHNAEVQSADTKPIPYKSLPDPSTICGQTSFYYRDLSEHLKREILKADLVLGAVAWLTDPVLLNALRSPSHGCALVVQKEDFLRTDTDGTNRTEWELELRKQYNALHCAVDRYSLPGIASALSMCSDPSVDGVRCVGNHNGSRNPVAPRMHNKFAVFCKVVGQWDEELEVDLPTVEPYAYWTGSFNWTRNAGRSFENAVLIYDAKAAMAAAEEWANIFSLSEPLDWTCPWLAPQYRIGS
jgi:hypothetical protein